MIHFKIKEIWCPWCLSDDIYYKYDEETEYPYRCWFFFCECNECGSIWEEDLKIREYE